MDTEFPEKNFISEYKIPFDHILLSFVTSNVTIYRVHFSCKSAFVGLVAHMFVHVP